MAITHANFLTQVRNYTEVDSNVLTDAIIQDFIRSVELDIAGKVDYDDLRKYATSNFTASNRYVAMPSDALILRSVQVNYIKSPPEFTSTSNTFLSTNQESMLLHGVLTEAFRFLKGPMDMYNLYEKKYNEEVQNFALQQMGRRRRAEYDDGVPRVQIPSPPPNTN